MGAQSWLTPWLWFGSRGASIAFRWGKFFSLTLQGMSRNFTEGGHRAGASAEAALQDPHRRGRENCSSLITNSLADIESSLQRDAEAAYMHAEVPATRAGCAAPGHCHPTSWV